MSSILCFCRSNNGIWSSAIGAYAFANNPKLTRADIASATQIGEGAFDGDAALSVLEVSSAKSIGNYAFRGTTALTEVSLPALETLGSLVFDGSSITEIDLPATVTSVAEQAFAGAKGLTSITVDEGNALYLSENGVLYRNTGSYNYVTLVAYPEGKTDTVFDWSDSSLRVIRIGAYAFANNPYLESITLPVHVRVIGAAAFYGCTALSRIEFLSATAPTLESYAYPVSQNGEVTSENVYNNFKTEIGKEHGITIVVPANNTGYDLYIWQQYFGELDPDVNISAQNQPIQSAINFMDRVGALPSPENITEADREEITVLQRIYNTLVSVQKQYVTGGYDGTDYYAILTAAANALPEQTNPDDGQPDDGTTEPQPPQEGGNLGLIIGLSVGGAVVLAGIAVAVVFIVRKKRRS